VEDVPPLQQAEPRHRNRRVNRDSDSLRDQCSNYPKAFWIPEWSLPAQIARKYVCDAPHERSQRAARMVTRDSVRGIHMWSFIAKVAGYAWKYGVKKINAVIAWIKKNWKTVLKWIEAGAATTTIIEQILRILF
jgi:hypothetical protein